MRCCRVFFSPYKFGKIHTCLPTPEDLTDPSPPPILLLTSHFFHTNRIAGSNFTVKICGYSYHHHRIADLLSLVRIDGDEYNPTSFGCNDAWLSASVEFGLRYFKGQRLYGRRILRLCYL